MNMIKLLIFILCLFFSAVYSQPFDFTYPINISNMGADFSSESSLLIDNDETIHLVFRHDLRTENTKSLFYCFRETNGIWSEPLQLTDSMQIYSPKIVVNDSNEIFITYQKLYYGEYFKTFVKIRRNNVWQEPFQISVDSLGWGFNPTIVIDSNNRVYVIYSNFIGIFWRKFENNNWSEVDSIITFPPALTALSKPLAIVDNNNFIHLVFRYYDENLHTRILYYMEYNGINWTEKYPISTIDSLGGPRDYDFALDNDNNPHVVYTQLSNQWPSILLYYTTKTNDFWAVPDSITSQNDGEIYNPKIKINPFTNKPLIISTISKRHNPNFIKNNKFIYNNGNRWVIEDILINFPNFTGSSFDFLFDENGNIHYVFSRTDTLTSVLADLYYTKGTVVTGVEKKRKTENSAIKLEAHPNPFNLSIIISYQIPNNEFVKIKIYDSLGREIEELVSENKSRGKHQVPFNADNIASGVYLVEIKAGKRYKTIKILLTK